jgi:anti-anti-sigma factor
MEVIRQLQEGIYTITLSGKFTFGDNPQFREILQNLIQQDVQQMVLQMAKVEFVDSADLACCYWPSMRQRSIRKS